MSFAKWVFRLAGIYGFVVLTPLLFLEPALAARTGPVTYPEYYYGFTGAALVFQALFLLISTDVARFRPAMLVSVAEKAAFPAAVWPLALQGRTQGSVVVFASVDAVLGLLFLIAWLRTRRKAA